MRTGTTGLWNLGRKTVKMALSWKLLTDLAQEGIGVNEVEAQAWTRTWNRETKKGKRLSNIKKGIYCGQLKRDKAYICKMMEIRSSQAREDWVSVRKEWFALKENLICIASKAKEKNRIRREWDKIQKENKSTYI